MEISAETAKLLAVGLSMGIGTIGPSIAIGMIGKAAMDALGRNPEARGPIGMNMVLAIAFAEAVAIYVLIIAVLLIFVV